MSEEHDSGRGKRTSEAPVDLTKEREVFVRTFLRKGVELTEELLAENDHLRKELARLERDNARLRAQVASDDAIRDLIRRIDDLESEKRRLLDRSHALEATHREDAGRYARVEAELNDLANLYIASYQLHASLSLRRVVRHLRDIVGQLVGSHGFVIYVVDAANDRVMPVGYEGLPDERVRPMPLGEGAVGETCLTGIERIRERFEGGSLEDPLAVIPLMAAGRPVGAIAIVSMLEQKKEWASVDRELFKLLGAHAGTALIAANLFSAVDGPEAALNGLLDNLASRPTETPPPGGE